MPNFNGAIIMHTLQLINSPATLREIVMTIAKHTEIPQDDLKVPVKQTLDMGQRYGFLQKIDGRYYQEPMSFTRMMSGMGGLDPVKVIEKPKPAKGEKKSIQKAPSKTVVEKKPSQKLATNPEPLKNPDHIPQKPLHDRTVKNSNPIYKNSLHDDTSKNPHSIPKITLNSDTSIASTSKTIVASRGKSVTSLANKTRRFKYQIIDP